MVKRSDLHFPIFIYDVRNAGSRKNVKRKILPLAAWDIGVAVDSAGAYPAGNIRNESRVLLNEVVAKTQVESEVVTFDSFENRLGDRGDVELMIAAQPAITSNDSAADAFCQK